jgi:hypothetical protein
VVHSGRAAGKVSTLVTVLVLKEVNLKSVVAVVAKVKVEMLFRIYQNSHVRLGNT